MEVSEISTLLGSRKITFSFSKHMDKHDRPYKCLIKGCQDLQGFTYSGGILRHEREVHKMHDSTKKSFFCTFSECKRSSGVPFTRKENLAEHVRRVHPSKSISADMHGPLIHHDSPIVNSRQASISPGNCSTEDRHGKEPSLKRKRDSNAVHPDRVGEHLQAIERLRHQNECMEARIQHLEDALAALQQNCQ